MIRGGKTDFILKQFKKKSKRLLKRGQITEFFHFNSQRKVFEFLFDEKISNVETFFKQFLPMEFRNFISIKILNDLEEEINTWYYDDENLVIVINVNWGFKKQEISQEISIENFITTIIDEQEKIIKKVDPILVNDFIISYLTINSRNLAEVFKKIN